MLVRLGDTVEPGQPLARVFAQADAVAHIKRDLLAAITIEDNPTVAPPLIVERIGA
jgi:thymidine phosphorylase